MMNRTALQLANNQIRTCARRQETRLFHLSTALLSSQREVEAKSKQKDEPGKPSDGESGKKRKKTMAELDAEMQAAMEGHAGDGGLAGAEMEGGKAVSMKRGVRDNMFRYI